MRIGILTFNESINYGSVLQAWALQKVLLDAGYAVEVIDYEPEAYHKLYDIFASPFSLSNIKINLKRLPLTPFLKFQKIKFGKFCSENLHLSAQRYTISNDSSEFEKIYDCIICGSDQIWNIRADDCDPIFFLPGLSNVRKIAYGISINDTDFTEPRYQSDLCNWILNFNKISSRENSGSEKIQRFICNKKKVDVVLDPTLLCSRLDFMEIASEPFVESKYIFLYSVWYNEQIAEAGRILSQKLNLPVYTILMGKSCRRLFRFNRNGVHCIMRHTGPEDFIRLLADAAFVLTDSFHGTAFSLIMEKQFVSINYLSSENRLKNDERITSILGTLGLQDRYLPIDLIRALDLTLTINYGCITQERLQLASNSKAWLFNAINNKADSHE